MPISSYPVAWVVILLIALEIASVHYNRLVLQYKFYRIFSWFGIFMHELSHWIFCKLSLAKVYEFKVGRYEGYVRHGKPKLPVVGAMLISLGPLIIGTAVLLLSFCWIAEIDYVVLKNVIQNEPNISIFENWKNVDFLTWKFFLYLAININILSAFVPSRQDYKNIAFFLLIYMGASVFLSQLDTINVLIANILFFSLILMVTAIIFLNIIEKVWRGRQ